MAAITSDTGGSGSRRDRGSSAGYKPSSSRRWMSRSVMYFCSPIMLPCEVSRTRSQEPVRETLDQRTNRLVWSAVPRRLTATARTSTPLLG